MVDLELVILIVFRLVNFGAVIAIGYYVFKTQLLPGLRDQMMAERKEHDALTGQVKHLKIDQAALDRAIANDIAQQRRLKEKVVRWHDALEAKRARLLQEQEQRREKLAAYYEDQIAHIQKEHTAKEILPFVIERARRKLAQDFASSTKQAAYFEHIEGVVKKMGSS